MKQNDTILKQLKLDPKSLKFKLWAYFALFAVLLMLVLWFLQIFFLNTYYQEMKVTETKRIAKLIAAQYGKENFIEKIGEYSVTNDIYIQIESFEGDVIKAYPTNSFKAFMYQEDLPAIRKHLLESGSDNVSVPLPEGKRGENTLAYASFLDKTPGEEALLYIFSPLYPVSSTISILTNQLVYVTIISLILAFILSFYLSNRIARPIRNITRQAKKLANGEYGIVFQGGHYTEIINLANTLTHTSLQLEKANTLQKDLIANVSHDLRTPLTMVKSYAEMIRDLSGDVPEKRNSHLQVIIDEADRLNLLVSDMLTLSRLQSGVVTVDPTNFSMQETAEAIVQSYALLEEQEGYSILLDCPEDLLVKGDPARIKQVVSNLLNNAVKYCGQDKTVFLSIRRVKNKMRCEITDHGMGIEPSELDQIWDRYYKASTNHIRTTTGTGLGLSIVKEILTMHNAKFGVVSELGKGSTFWFELEIARIANPQTKSIT